MQTLPKYNLRSEQFRQNPFPTWKAMREHDPVYWHPDFQMWFLTRHADVAALLDEKRFSIERLGHILAGVRPETVDKRDVVHRFLLNWMSLVDSPRHHELRSLVSRAFTVKASKGLRPFIQDVVTRRLDEVAPRGSAELIADIAKPIPCEVIAHMLGMPLADFPEFIQWSDALVAVLSLPADLDRSIENAYSAIGSLNEYFAGPIEHYRRHPEDNFLSGLVNAEVDGVALNFDELVATLALMLVGGNETSRKLIANSVVALLEHPDQLALLRDNPDRMPDGVEELIRYDGVAVQFIRHAREDTDFGGTVVPAGDVCFGSVHAANRDPVVFTEPDRVDIDRPGKKSQLGFGGGPHFCIGAALGRYETEIALNGILARLPDLALATDHLEWEESAMHRSPDEVPITFTPTHR